MGDTVDNIPGVAGVGEDRRGIAESIWLGLPRCMALGEVKSESCARRCGRGGCGAAQWRIGAVAGRLPCEFSPGALVRNQRRPAGCATVSALGFQGLLARWRIGARTAGVLI